MNPFEQLPDELILEQCNTMDNEALIRFAGAYGRGYNICREVILRRNLFKILNLSKVANFPHNTGEISIVNINKLPIIISREKMSITMIQGPDQFYYFYSILPDVWIGEKGLFAGQLKVKYPKPYIKVEPKGQFIDELVHVGKGVSMTRDEANIYINNLLSKDGYYVSDLSNYDIDDNKEIFDLLVSSGVIKLVDYVRSVQ